MFYVYVLARPNGAPFYIGMSKAKLRSAQRISQHFYDARSGARLHRHNVIRKTWKEGLSVICAVDSWHLSRSAAAAREVQLIREFGRRDIGNGVLANKTAGGEGVSEPSPQARAIIARSSSEKNRAWFADPDNRRRFAERARLFYRENPDARARISASQKLIANDPQRMVAFKDRMARWRKDEAPADANLRKRKASATLRSPEFRSAASARSIRQFSEANQRLAQAERVKKRFSDPAERTAQSERLLVSFSDPHYRIKRSEISKRQMAAPAMRQRLADAANAQWANPEARSQASVRASLAALERRTCATRCRAIIAGLGIEFKLPSLMAGIGIWQETERSLLSLISTKPTKSA